MTGLHPNFVIGIVDDDQRILEALGSLLESADYDVRLFSSARTLLDSPQLAGIDCLISDIDMPVMNGFELLRELHAKRPELPVIIITGHPEMLGQSSSIDLGHCAILRKPFDGQELLTAISNALPNSSQRRSIP